MKSILLAIIITLLPIFSIAAVPADIPGVIPKPFKMTMGEGNFLLDANTPIFWDNDEAAPVAQLLSEGVSSAFGLELKVRAAKKAKAGIFFIFDKQAANEEYTLTVTPTAITVRGSASGLFYGAQTLLQLMPAESKTSVSIPCTDILDKPRFGHRGAMLDVGRYFFSARYVKHFIDLMAFYKLNILHFHLTEDGGWRMEVKKYPELTTIGAWRRSTHIGRRPDTFDRLPHGGFYTQEELRDLVAYAQSKHVTIVPEIDMPGHMLAALAAYPHLSCTGGPFKVLEQWGIQKDVLCAGNEETYRFVEGVLEELVDIFPSEIIHIGGDEAPKDRWKACPKCQAKMTAENLKDEHELQSYFIRRVAAFLESKGRRILGWDEILEGGIAPNAMVMSWRGEEGGITAARQSHDVIMTPTKFCYLDYYQSKPENEPFNISGNLPLEKVYSYEPIPAALEKEFHKHIMGLQGNIWMEYIHTETKIEYMAFPRLLAIAETGWSEKGKEYENFLDRLAVNLLWMDKKYVNYRIPEPRGLADMVSDQNSVSVNLHPPVKGANIFYTLDGSDPMQFGIRYQDPITIQLTSTPVTLQCIVRTPVGKVSAIYSATYAKKAKQ